MRFNDPLTLIGTNGTCGWNNGKVCVMSGKMSGWASI